MKKITDKIIAVKVENTIYSYSIQKSKDGIINLKVNYDNVHDYYVQMPKGDWVLVGYSHQLTDTQISSLGFDRNEFARLLEQNNVKYDYTSWEGKWLILFNRN